jgi:uncharacterized membrane protein YhaH (DUF805 family)
MSWYIKVLKNYAVFSGRARRKEYWWFSLFNFIFILVLDGIDLFVIAPHIHSLILPIVYTLTIVSSLTIIYILAVIVPGIAVGVRRLHDTNRSGWWYFIGLIPIVGSIILIVFYAMDSQPGDNRYGPNPKTEVTTAV